MLLHVQHLYLKLLERVLILKRIKSTRSNSSQCYFNCIYFIIYKYHLIVL